MIRFFVRHRLGVFTAATATLAAVACGSDKVEGNNVTCGTGTKLDGTTCIADGTGTGPSGTNPDGGPGPGPGPGTDSSVAVEPPTFAGVTSVSPAAATSLQITWAAATDKVTPPERISYNVYVGTAAGGQNFGAPTFTAPPGSTSVLLNTLEANKDYFVVVRAVNDAKVEDKNTTEQSGKTQPDTTVPTFAGATGAEPADNASLKVSWAAATDDLTKAPGMSYLVYLATDTGTQDFSGPSYVSDVGATSIVIPSLPKPDTTYYAVVRARDAAGNMDDNKIEVSGKSGLDKVAPVFAGCTSATVKDANSVTVTWNVGKDDSTPTDQLVYDVFASKTAGQEDFTTPTTTFTSGTSGIVSGLSQATTYYFVCRARDASGNADQNKSERLATTLADGTPPTFAGLTGVTNIGSTTVDLTWAAGSDDKTATEDIVYDVYQADATGGQIFTAAPTASSQPGATTITLTDLTPAASYYWVVRARDKAGNHDSNTVEKNATMKVSFLLNVAPILGQHCAVPSCHVPPTGINGLVMTPPSVAYGNLYNHDVVEIAGYKRVKPSDYQNSYIYMKINNVNAQGQPGAPFGTQMPPPQTNDSLTQVEKDTIKTWIVQGALNN